MSDKRAHSPDEAAGALVVKKARTDGHIIHAQQGRPGADFQIKRTSGLLAPIMRLTGHSSEVFSAKFSPDGQTIATGSNDKFLFLWRVYGECENYMMLKGHKNAVLEVSWFQDGERIITASADKTVRGWDTTVGEQVKKVTEHEGVVNSVCTLKRGPPLFVTGSDDGTVKVWDMRRKRAVATLADKFQVLSVGFSDAGDQVYSGGLDNTVKVWELRKEALSMTLEGHTDTVTGMKVSPDGTHLLSNSMDNTLRIWDLRPFAPVNRCIKVLNGHVHTFEKTLLRCDWSPDGTKVTSGSGDRNVYVWDVESRRLMYKLPGHTGSVNEAVFHPKEPIVASASSDNTIYLGELML